MDGDGRDDVLVVQSWDRRIAVVRDGELDATDVTVPPFGWPARIGDVDGDGFGDVGLGDGTPETPYLAIHRGTPGGLDPIRWAALPLSPLLGGSRVGVVGAGDLNGDGLGDFLYAVLPLGWQIVYGGAEAATTGAFLAAPSDYSEGLLTNLELDGDAHSDLFFGGNPGRGDEGLVFLGGSETTIRVSSPMRPRPFTVPHPDDPGRDLLVGGSPLVFWDWSGSSFVAGTSVDERAGWPFARGEGAPAL